MDVYLPRFVPKSTLVTVAWIDKLAVDKPVSKGKVIGKVSFDDAAQTLDIRAPISGVVASMVKEPIQPEEDIEHGKMLLMRIDTCKHPLVYDGICTICFEPNIKKHTQKIFDKIQNISASDEIVKDKITEITRGHKMILILDLDNTIIHARQVPVDFDFREKFKDEKESDFFEVCQSSSTKFLVRKRTGLDKFLERLDESFAIFVYTFGTRSYGLEVIHNIDPEQKILKKSRLISKSDYDLNHKELEKIIPEKYRDLVLILDDNVDVWRKYKDNLVQVFPYYYWIKEEDNEEIRTVSHPDYYLHYLGHFLQRSVAIYKRYKEEHQPKTLKFYRIVRVLHSLLFFGKSVNFTCVVAVANPDEVLRIRESIIIKQKHGKVSLTLDGASMVVANTFKATKKIKEAKSMGKPTAHFSWIRYSVVNLVPMSTDFFDVANITEAKLSNIKDFEQSMADHHTYSLLTELSTHIDDEAYRHLCHEDKLTDMFAKKSKICDDDVEVSENESRNIVASDIDGISKS